MPYAPKMPTNSSSRRWVVTGPPGGGKTTWVSKQRQPGEFVWDADAIAAAIANEPRFPRSHHVNVALKVLREAMLRHLESTEAACYVIVTDASDAASVARRLRAQLKRCEYQS